MNNENQISPEGRGSGGGMANLVAAYNLAGGGAAWMLHLLLSYLVAEFGCLAGLGEARWLGLTAVAWLLLLVSVLALALAGMATFVSWKSGGQWRRGGRADEVEADARQFAARAGLITNALFVGVILVESVPVFYYWSAC